MNDLELISTSDMLDELGKRHDAMIFASYQDRTKEDSHYNRYTSGGNIPCLGLARFIQLRIEEACNEMDQEEEEEEEEVYE